METNKVMVVFDVSTIKAAISKSSISQKVITKMVLNRDPSFLSNSYTRGTMNKEDLKKLCEFLSLDYDSVVVAQAETTPAKDKTTAIAHGQSIDTLIVGLNAIYEIEKENNKLLTDLLQELKVSNTKAGRFENIMGQVHSNILIMKESMSKDMIPYIRDTKTATATMSGRMKELLSKFKG